MITNRLKELLDFNSQSGLQDNVKQLCDFVGQQLEELGFAVTPLEYNGVHSLYAHPTGAKHAKVLLQGHIDVVPAVNQPFRQDGDKIFGRGTYDMLYGTACYLELMDELKVKIPELDVAIMLSGDEELGGFNGVQPFLNDGYSADICILPDAGEGFGSLNVAAKGFYSVFIRIDGIAHHGSRPWEGDGATSKLVHFLSDMEQVFDTSSKDNSTMTIAQMKAGDSENKGPATADVVLDIRYKDKTDLARIQGELQSLLTTYNGAITHSSNGSDYQLNTKNPYVQKFIGLYEQQLGTNVSLTKAHGSSDARFFSEHDIPVIMLRPDGGGAHGDNEWISNESVNAFYKLLKEYVQTTGVVE